MDDNYLFSISSFTDFRKTKASIPFFKWIKMKLETNFCCWCCCCCWFLLIRTGNRIFWAKKCVFEAKMENQNMQKNPSTEAFVVVLYVFPIWWENKIDTHPHSIESVFTVFIHFALHKIQNSIKLQINLLLIKLVQVRYIFDLNEFPRGFYCMWVCNTCDLCLRNVCYCCSVIVVRYL